MTSYHQVQYPNTKNQSMFYVHFVENFLLLFNRSRTRSIGVLNFIYFLATSFDFFMLQLIQAATTLSHLVLPPRDFGKT